MLELNHIHKYYNAGTVNEMCLFNDFFLFIEDGQLYLRSVPTVRKLPSLNWICGKIAGCRTD